MYYLIMDMKERLKQVYNKIIRFIFKKELAEEASNWRFDYLNDLMERYLDD